MSVFIGGIYNLQDIKYDILKIIEPYDGYMYNQTDTDRVTHLFNSFLGDLRQARKIYEYEVTTIDKDNAVTFDVVVKLHRDRSPKKLKIHVGRLVHFRDIQAA
jgi:hypothetical protein